MNMFKITENIIDFSRILEGERVLIVDDNTSSMEYLSSIHDKKLISFCHDSDFRAITKHPEEYLNAFDVVICAKALYNIPVSDRLPILECLVYAMNESSRLIMAFPNIRNFPIEKTFELDNQKYILLEEDKFFLLKRKFFMFSKLKEVWNKSALYYYSQIFKVWNSTYDNCQWDFDNIAIIDYKTYFLACINMKKKFITGKKIV